MAAVAQATTPGAPGGTAPPAPDPSTPGHYVNPFSDPAWQPSRIDMGVDWIETKPLPVRAIGQAVILGAQNHAPWPGKHYIFYELLTGSHAGDVVYVAEHIRNLVRAGTVVAPGQRIATAVPGYPWTEWGWADAYGSPRALPCYRNGRATHSGREMARFLISVGARLATAAGTSSDSPTGRRC